MSRKSRWSLPILLLLPLLALACAGSPTREIGAAVLTAIAPTPTAGALAGATPTPDVVATVQAISAALTAQPITPATPAPGSGRIAFESDRDGDTEIYVMAADGSGQTNLTNHPATDGLPSWSPDGTQVAFQSNRDGNREIYVVAADGGGQTNLTNHPAEDRFPAWSPDGTRIAFVSDRDANSEIYLMNADGSAAIRLTHHPAVDEKPAWSPDGAWIAFWSNRDGNREIYLMSADGSGQTNLTHSRGSDVTPSWSPDGRQIAFVSERDGNSEIYAMYPDGSGQRNLTMHPAHDWWPCWSPDGTRIAFYSYRDGKGEVYVMEADGSGQANLTGHPKWDGYPAWGPSPAIDTAPLPQGAPPFFTHAEGDQLTRTAPPADELFVGSSAADIEPLAGYPIVQLTEAGREERLPERVWGYGDVTSFALYEVTYDPTHRVATSVYLSGEWHPQAGTMVCDRDEDRVFEHGWLTSVNYLCDCCVLLFVRQMNLRDPATQVDAYWIGASASSQPMRIADAAGEFVSGHWTLEKVGDPATTQTLRWTDDQEYGTLRWQACGSLFELRAVGQDGGFTFEDLVPIAKDIHRQVACE